jgi:hypothetical protein
MPGLRLLKPTLLAVSVNPAADGPALPRARGSCRGARWTRAVSTLCEPETADFGLTFRDMMASYRVFRHSS